MIRQTLWAMSQVFRQPAFVVVSLVLLAAAVGSNATTRFLKLHYKKQPVALVRPLHEVSSRLGPWELVTIDEPVSAEFEEALATDKYVFRDYVDTRLVSRQQLDQFKNKTAAERKKLALELQQKNPAAVVNIGLTYYTGLVDTVAHIPDRCYIADGYEPAKYDLVAWDALRGRAGDQKLRFIVFEDPTPGRKTAVRNVAYFFHCNGKYMNDPIDVRKSLADLFEKYGYYMKVELHTLDLPAEQASGVMNDLLIYLLPEVEKCLPDWEKLRSAG